MRISPSKISTFMDCPVKYWWDELFDIPRERKIATEEGEVIHKMAEEWMVNRTMPSDESGSDRLIKAFQALLPMLPSEPLPKSAVEKWFTLRLQGWPEMKGRIDYIVRPKQQDDTLDPDVDYDIDSIPEEYWLEVNDIKTTSDLVWAKTYDDLLTDPQSVTYTTFFLQLHPFVKFSLRYVQRKKPHYTKTVSRKFTRAIMGPQFVTMYDTVVRSMVKVYNTREFHKLTPNTEACGKYNGCSYRSYCGAQGISVLSY